MNHGDDDLWIEGDVTLWMNHGDDGWLADYDDGVWWLNLDIRIDKLMIVIICFAM